MVNRMIQTRFNIHNAPVGYFDAILYFHVNNSAVNDETSHRLVDDSFILFNDMSFVGLIPGQQQYDSMVSHEDQTAE
jgi:hypothetical protein